MRAEANGSFQPSVWAIYLTILLSKIYFKRSNDAQRLRTEVISHLLTSSWAYPFVFFVRRWENIIVSLYQLTVVTGLENYKY